MKEKIFCTTLLAHTEPSVSLNPITRVWAVNLSGSESDMISVWHHEQSSVTVINNLTVVWQERKWLWRLQEEDRGGVDEDGQCADEYSIREQIWRMQRKTATLRVKFKCTRVDEQLLTGWKLNTPHFTGSFDHLMSWKGGKSWKAAEWMKRASWIWNQLICKGTPLLGSPRKRNVHTEKL